MAGHQAGNPQRQAVAMEDLGEALAHHGADPPAHQCLRCVLATRTAAEVAVDQQDRRTLMLGTIKGMRAGDSLSQFGAIVGEGSRAEGIEGDALEETGRNDPIGIDVITANHHGGAAHRCDRAGGEGSGTGHGWGRAGAV